MITTNNNKEIMQEAATALDVGVSYGKFKAGISADYAPSEYDVKTGEYIKKSSKEQGETKITAYIK